MIYCKRLIEPLEGRHEERLIDRNLLPPDFWRFASSWINRASKCISQPKKHFEGLIYLWVVFNAWASQIIIDESKSNRDHYLVAALCFDQKLNKRFEKLKEIKPDFRNLTAEFASMWPIFRVRTLRVLRLPFWHGEGTLSRWQYVNSIFHNKKHAPKAYEYAPPCYREHENERHVEGAYEWFGPPNDWAHTLKAIYQIRCNLFHGGKDFENSTDKEFVGKAFRILWEVWREEIPDHLEDIQREKNYPGIDCYGGMGFG